MEAVQALESGQMRQVKQLGPQRQLEALREDISRWAVLWGVPRMGGELRLRVSTRMRRSIGSYRAARDEIALAAWLFEATTAATLLEEVLCHEAAHAAVHRVHGRSVRPHGREWRGFMERAGLRARVRIPLEELPATQRGTLVQAGGWVHRCPICQATRLARTRVPRWRCRRCRERGLGGELRVERVGAASGFVRNHV
jgi:predicted SprT family Zn-dependent metalloprotease